MQTSPWSIIGWRNLWRNKRRTVLAASGLAVGYFSVVIMVGLSKGMIAEMIDNGTGLIDGQLQLHERDYLPERSIHQTISFSAVADLEDVLEIIESDAAVYDATPRVFGGGLVSAGSNTVAGILVGIDPVREAEVARVARAVQRGRRPRTGASEILIGEEMARRLRVDLGDEVVVVTPAADGSLGNDLFTVVGIFATGLVELDASYSMLPIDVMQQLLALAPGRVHEIAVRVHDPWAAVDVAQRLSDQLGSTYGNVDVQAWQTYRPEMFDYANLAEASYWIILIIVFGMAIFGVANTMLMATYERRREFALLLALGSAPFGIVRSVLVESLALGTIGLIAGAAITFPVLVWWHNAPLDLSGLIGGFTMLGGFIRPVLRIEYPGGMLVLSALALLLTALAAAVYPSIRASRVPPADTLMGR